MTACVPGQKHHVHYYYKHDFRKGNVTDGRKIVSFFVARVWPCPQERDNLNKNGLCKVE